MPVFNHTADVAIMLDSILANSFDSWELLAVDDGSEADTLELLRRYKAADDRVHVIQRQEQPKGAQTCRNIGLREARGEYIAFLDSDDYITPSCLQTRVDTIASRPDLDFVVFPSGIYGSHGFDATPGAYTFGYKVHRDDLWAFASRNLPFIVWNNIYRTSALRSGGVQWDTALLSLQDSDFNLQCLLAGLSYTYASVPPDYGYRVEAGTETISKKINSKEHFASQLHLVDKCFTTIQAARGHQYDHALYYGCTKYYMRYIQHGMTHTEALQVASAIGRHTALWGHIFAWREYARQLLARIIGKRIATKIVLLPFLIKRKMICWRTEHNKSRIYRYINR